jgi:hypothetical protein
MKTKYVYHDRARRRFEIYRTVNGLRRHTVWAYKGPRTPVRSIVAKQAEAAAQRLGQFSYGQWWKSPTLFPNLRRAAKLVRELREINRALSA